jgi:hypothetical protein
MKWAINKPAFFTEMEQMENTSLKVVHPDNLLR